MILRLLKLFIINIIINIIIIIIIYLFILLLIDWLINLFTYLFFMIFRQYETSLSEHLEYISLTLILDLR